MLTKPILFLLFNRLDTTKRVLAEIAKAKPPRFYIACDGARENKEGEKEKVMAVRDYVLTHIDWDCEVKTLFQDKNLGCGCGVNTAITWFFEHEVDGIILEDDCLPHPTFFSYCETLLDYYKNEERVMHIGSNRFIDFEYGDASYYFATIEHCWGWASWARAWKHFDLSLEKYKLHVVEERLFYFYRDSTMREYWKNIYSEMKNGKTDSWAYPWTLSIMACDGLAINPNVNLISNIGFSGDGTHTFGSDNPYAGLPVFPLENIIHPTEIKRSMFIDEKIMETHFSIKDNATQRIQQLEERTQKPENQLLKIKRFFSPMRPVYQLIKKIKQVFK